MFKIIIGMIIGIILTLIILAIQHYLKDNNLRINWKNVLIALGVILIIVWLIYNFMSLTIGPEYTKSNGNICKGYRYGLKICWGDINVE